MEEQMVQLDESRVIEELLATLPEDTKLPITQCFYKVYESFLASELAFDVGEQATDHEETLIKMFVILKGSVAPFILLDYFCYDALMISTKKHLHDFDHPLFPFYVGLHTILLQRLWNLHARALELKQKNPIYPIELKFVVNSVDELAKILFGLLDRRDWNLLHAQLIINSLLTLLHQFFLRPMEIKSEKKIVSVKQPKVSGKQFQQIVNFVEFYVFHVGSKASNQTANFELQKKILLNLAELVKNNMKVPETYHLFKIVRFFNSKSIFKIEIKSLLMILFERKKVFFKTIAMVIVDFAKHNRSRIKFMQFFVYLDQFLVTFDSEFKFFDIKWHIGAYIIKKLPVIITMLPSENRVLQILDRLLPFLMGMNKFKKKKM